MDNVLNSFNEYLMHQGKSPLTVFSYTNSVKKYFNWYEKKYHDIPVRLIEENVLSFKQHLIQQEKSAGTVNIYLHSLRSFNEFLIEENEMTTMVIHPSYFQSVQSQLTSPLKFEVEEIERFFQTILNDDVRHEKYVYRDYVIAKTMALAGLRVSEVLVLTLDDVKFTSKELIVRNGKGDKTRTVLLNQELSRLLHKYIREIRPSYPIEVNKKLMFMNRTGKLLSRKTVYYTFQQYSKNLNLPTAISPHDMRHYFCTNAINAGLDVHEVAYLAGHSNVQTTLRYTNVSRKQLLDKLDNL